uniref:ATP-dependent DNA helicase n=1 Tax=Aegilops tauschii subsp. strangulata TaxID=200361 RepID=A0A453QHP2_AEGTS
MKKQLFEKTILGKVKAYTYVVEFQKWGLPHAHFLLTMTGKYKYTGPEQYDRIISAELPNKHKYPELYKMVIKHMIHGPCGALNKKFPCTKNRPSCKNNYPRPFSETTIQGKDCYPLYRRRNNGSTEIVRNWKLDNRWVVPYNPYLLRMLNCHINVEICSSIKAVKYLFKFMYKGHDRAFVTDKVDEVEIDEIRQYRDTRWVTPTEALWRIYGFELSKIHPSVLQLHLHLPNMHMVSYHVKEKIKNIIDRDGTKKSMLTTYFEANNLHVKARGILYRDFPEYYTRQRRGKFWQERKRAALSQVGRIISAHPAEGERYYLRVLLNHVTGATSYEGLRTIDGQVMPTFREAAEKRGLIEADNTLDDAMTEAELFQVSSSLRRLFTTILVFCMPNDVHSLWNNHLKAMSEDYNINCKCKHTVEQMVLKNISDILHSMGKDIESFPLPKIDKQNGTTNDVPKEIIEETSIEVDPEDASLHKNLNNEQRKAYDKILATVDCQRGGLFFVDGPGGTGNTFLYRALLATIRGQGKIAVATATSGVAASIMPGGRTAHPRFKIPLRIDDGDICGFTKQSGTAKLLQAASLIIWDEASMTKRQTVEALDKSMRDIMDKPDLPFGGKTVVFGGDFRQVLPIVRKGTRAQIVDASLREEMVYHSFDSVEDDPHNYYPPKFLNTLTPNGLPPHMLKLKINCPIILLRNIDPANGLCNGTRLLVRGFQKNAIDAEIVVGQHSGMRVFLPRIPLCPSDDDMFPFSFKRKQFSIRLSFAMTINKSQGQTIANVGIYLPEPVFSHGQLYVALSRATTTANIKVLTGTHDENKEKNKKISTSDTYTKEEKKKKNKNKNISASKTYTK